jgi:hypothetical protein
MGRMANSILPGTNVLGILTTFVAGRILFSFSDFPGVEYKYYRYLDRSAVLIVILLTHKPISVERHLNRTQSQT